MAPSLTFYLTVVLPGCGFTYAAWRVYHEGTARYWLGDLQARSSDFYPTIANRFEDFRLVSSPDTIPNLKSNIGVGIQGPILNDIETVFLYRYLKQLVKDHGSPLGTTFSDATNEYLREAEAKASIDGALTLTDMRIGVTGAKVSDLWGAGDSLDPRDVPPWLRHFTRKVKKLHPVDLGELRHIHVDYYPSGVPYMAPTRLPEYAGYDYFVVPIRAPRRRDVPIVLTLSPTLRSKTSNLAEVASSSWTSRDWDAKLERACALHVFAKARIEWRMGIRPAQWFGSTSVPIELPPKTSSSSPLGVAWWKRLLFSKKADPSSDLLCPPEFAEDDGVVIVTVGFEGAGAKRRSLLGRPESRYFGLPPSADRATWNDDDRNKWDAINWKEVRSWRDVSDVVMTRVEAARTRRFYGSIRESNDL